MTAVSTTNRVFNFDEEFTFEETMPPIKNIKDIGMYEDIVLWATNDGHLIFTENNEITYKYFLSGPLKKVFMLNKDEVFLVYERSKTFLFNRKKYLNWKKNYFDIQVLYYEPESKLICY